MTITATSTASQGQEQMFTASHFDDAGSPAVATFYPGFKPRYVRVENVTDRIMWEWYEGSAAATCQLTVAAGTRTIITSAGITCTVTDGARPSVAFPPVQNKQYRIQVCA
jgi:hypothetical protein